MERVRPDLHQCEVQQRRRDAQVPGTGGEVAEAPAVPSRPVGPALWILVFLAGVYGGYFVAAQGVLLVGILGVFLLAPLQSANAGGR